QGGGRSLEELNGAASLLLSSAMVNGQKLGPVQVVARAEKGQVRVSTLEARVPGLVVTGHGSFGGQGLDVSGSLRAQDLGALAKAVGALTHSSPPPLSGRGDLHFSLGGTLQKPKLSTDGVFPSLAWGASRVRALSLKAQLPDLLH